MRPGTRAQHIVICGGTSGVIASAIAAARMGSEATLVETRKKIGGIRKKFIAGMRKHYVTTYGADDENTKLCHNGY